jgi:hypothetical protein
LASFFVIRIRLSCHFRSSVDDLGLRRNGSSSPVINQGQDLLEQAPWHSHLGQLERYITAMANDLGHNLHQLQLSGRIVACTAFARPNIF